ncbi:hypothetical protein PRIPAC_93677 [Pristionchus pacificus]|uniref:PDZ domain-containing protein n=1 Tax=Pristionchus pacificus TaxID=54126 RepID=A0A2A6BAF6_PRIPA|nr:hypothetical protein PRIPAC_93677 [Pristionchus pacificus]|eukprot:PDM62869.1 PDZ domain-containing protein [Pristionchus pacificus]
MARGDPNEPLSASQPASAGPFISIARSTSTEAGRAGAVNCGSDSAGSGKSASSTNAGKSANTVVCGSEDSALPISEEALIVLRMKTADGRFGFNVKGGADQNYPVVSRIAAGSSADKCYPRLNEGDQRHLLRAVNYQVVLINGRDIFKLPHGSIASNTQRVLSNDRHSPPEILGLNARIRIAFLVGLHEFGHSTARNARWEGSLESYHNCRFPHLIINEQEKPVLIQPPRYLQFGPTTSVWLSSFALAEASFRSHVKPRRRQWHFYWKPVNK